MNRTGKNLVGLAGGLVTLLAAVTVPAQEPTRLLWGDTHLHTSLSPDAYTAGNRSAGPDVAYRYAKGEPVVHPYNRTRVQILQPLDFLAVSDHAEYLGVMPAVMGGEVEQPEAGILEKIKSWAMVTLVRYLIEEPRSATKRFTQLLPEPEVQSGTPATR